MSTDFGLVRYHLGSLVIDGPSVEDGIEVEVTLIARVQDSRDGKFLLVQDWKGPTRLLPRSHT